MNSETFSSSRIRIPLRLNISVISRLSPRIISHWTREKLADIHMAWAVNETIFRVTAGFQSRFYSNRRFSECRNKLLEEGYLRIFKISKFLKGASKTWHLIILAIESKQIFKTTSANTESTLGAFTHSHGLYLQY